MKRASMSVVGAIALALTAACLVGQGSGATTSRSAADASAADAAANLVANPGFESGTSHWRVNRTDNSKLVVTSGGRHGKVGVISNTSKTAATVALNDQPDTVTGAAQGTKYVLSAWVKAPSGKVSGAIRLREGIWPGKAIEHQTGFWLTDTAWHQVTLTITTSIAKAGLDLNVVAWQLPAGKQLAIDDLSLTAQAPPASPWQLTYQTNFHQDDGWTKREESQANDSSYNLPRNAVFDQSGLHILGKRENWKGKEYTSADITGLQPAMVLPNYFRAEVTGSAPAATGLWPCVLWFRPANSPDGEIDLMENFGGQPTVKATLHNQYGSTHRQFGQTLPWASLPNPDPAGMHTYTIEKRPASIKIWVDGKLLLAATPSDVPAGFDWNRIFENAGRTWYPRITLQIGYGSIGTSGVGNPAPSFRQTEIHVTSLKLWKLKG